MIFTDPRGGLNFNGKVCILSTHGNVISFFKATKGCLQGTSSPLQRMLFHSSELTTLLEKIAHSTVYLHLRGIKATIGGL